MKRLFILSLLAAIGSTASAHPGHGLPPSSGIESIGMQGIWHYATSPSHALPVLMTGMVLVVMVWLAVRKPIPRHKSGSYFHADAKVHHAKPRWGP